MKNTNIDSIVNILLNKTWRKRGKWHHVAFFDEMLAGGESTTYAKKLGYPFKKQCTVWLANGDYLDLQEDWEEMRKVIETGHKNETNYLKKYADHCLTQGDKLTTFYKNIKNQQVGNFTDKQLIQTYHEMVEEMKTFMPFTMSVHLVDEMLTESFALELKKYIQKNSLTQNDYFEYQTALALPYRKIFVLEEQDDLLKIAADMQKNGLEISDPRVMSLLDAHTEKYSWINCYLLEGLPYTRDEFAQRLAELLTFDAQKEYQIKLDAEEKLKQQQQKYSEALGQYPELLELSKLVQIFGFLRSYRVDVLFYSFVMAWNVVEEIAKRLEIPVIDFKYLDSSEMENGLLNKSETTYRTIIETRKNGFISVVIGDNRYELVDEDMKKIEAVVKLAEQKTDGVLSGSVAFPGKLTARCKVLHNLEDMKKVKEGDVMVIAMTDPNYIPAMRKAAAFVTDQGGILCHAAIVSREMKKPCIIGTKFATKVLNDGDLIEVDTDNGTVAIVEKNMDL